MMQILNLMKLVIGLLPDIIKAMTGVEEILNQSGLGTSKLDIFKVTLQNTYVAVDKTMPTLENLMNTVSSVISGIVSIFNSVGVFKK